jgi:hypothetical protein
VELSCLCMDLAELLRFDLCGGRVSWSTIDGAVEFWGICGDECLLDWLCVVTNGLGGGLRG